MSGFDPGPGWREVTYDEWRSDECPTTADTAYVRVGDKERYYFREVPVPPLPTTPYTAIRVTWRGGSDVGRLLLLGDDGLWTGRMSSQAVASAITGFEVLAEPRAVTVKAVLDRVLALVGNDSVMTLGIYDQVTAEFGASS